jgi:protein tyrosine phosphatase (PTP) superfamily phosphohydrolase (DUF442 family)
MVKDKPKSLDASQHDARKAPRGAKRLNKILVCLLILLPFLALGIWLFLSEYVYFNFHVIVPGQAYRCAQPSPAFLRRVVRQDHIKSIIKLNRTAESSWSAEEQALAKKLGVTMIYIPIGVSQLPTRPEMIQIIRALDRAPRPVLIHCKTGADRTGLAAVLIALKNGESFEHAKAGQLRLAYLHVGQWGEDVDDVLTQYQEDMAAEGKPIDGYAQFRRYVLEEYYPSFYHARIAPVQNTLTGRPGQIVTFTVQITNLARRPWAGGFFSSFFLDLEIPGTGADHFPELLASADIGKTLAPGATETVHLPVKIPDVPAGVHRYPLDVELQHGQPFSYFGSQTANVYLNVQREPIQ